MEEKRRPEQMTGSRIEGFSNDDSGKDEVSSFVEAQASYSILSSMQSSRRGGNEIL